MDSENDFFIWEKLRETLKLLRGKNLFRGREDHDPEKGTITLERERRGDGEPRGSIRIFFGEKTGGIFAEVLPEKKKIFLNDFEDNLNFFLEKVVSLSRGEKYIRTNSLKADYREEK